MLTEALCSVVAEAVFGYLLQESGPADRVRAALKRRRWGATPPSPGSSGRGGFDRSAGMW